MPSPTSPTSPSSPDIRLKLTYTKSQRFTVQIDLTPPSSPEVEYGTAKRQSRPASAGQQLRHSSSEPANPLKARPASAAVRPPQQEPPQPPQQQQRQVLGWKAYARDPRLFNDAAIANKARAANSVPAQFQGSLRRVEVRSIVNHESNVAPFSDFAMLQPKPVGIGHKRTPESNGEHCPAPYALHNTSSAFNSMVMDAERTKRTPRPSTAPVATRTTILGTPLRAPIATRRVVWASELGGWVNPHVAAEHRASQRVRSNLGFGGRRRLSHLASGPGLSPYDKRQQGSSQKWMDWGGGDWRE